MKSFLKIVLCIFAMFTSAGEVQSSAVISIFGDLRTAITLNDTAVMSEQTIGYNAFNKAAWMVDTVGDNAYRLEIIYGPDGQRWKTALQKNGSVIKTVIFAGDYEKITEDGVTRELVYLPGGGIYVRQAGQPDKVYYAHTDHLGSIVSITDGAGTEVFKASYDAWGKQIITNNTIGFHRGYTGHEHLPEFGLINMNGRMYDPIVGRFLSPDPYVQAPDFSQSFNRYSYAWNNPLIYTDPSGEFIFTILAAIFCQPLVPAAAQLDMAWMQGGFMEMANGGNFWNGAGKGFVTGAMNAGLSFLNVPGMIPNGLLHAGGNVLTNGITNVMYGQDFWQGAGWQAGFGFAGGAYSGYQMAQDIGLNPWTGGLNSSDRQVWQAYKNGSMSMTDATAALHDDYYTEAGSPEVTLGTKTNSRGTFIPVDPNGNDISSIVAASRDYSSVGGRIEIHPAGMKSGRRFLFTTYHELTHAKMFYNGDMHNRYNFLAMNYNVGIKTNLNRMGYYQAGLKSFTERWAYGEQWARWGINRSRINTVGAMWQQLLKLHPTQVDLFNSLIQSF